MSEEELRKNDILFQIDMQLYDEFNDKLCEMDEHLGDIYSLRDIEEVKQAEKEKERELLREAIKKLQKENVELEENNLSYQKELAKAWKENEELKEENKKQYKQFIKDHTEVIEALKKEQEDKIRDKIKELEDIKNKNIEYCSKDYFQLERAIKVLKELLN